MHPFWGCMIRWSRGYSISVDYWYRRLRFESPRGQMVFSMMFHDKILLYIKLINKLRYCSIDYLTKIASAMMWELTLGEWEKTVLLNSWLDASFLGMHYGLKDIAYLLTTDTGDAGSSPHVARWFFQWCSMTKYCYIYIINKWTTLL